MKKELKTLLKKYKLHTKIFTNEPLKYELHLRWLPKSELKSDFDEQEEKYLIKYATTFVEHNIKYFVEAYLNKTFE